MLKVRDLKRGEKLILEREDTKECYIVAEGLLQYVPNGLNVDIAVILFMR